MNEIMPMLEPDMECSIDANMQAQRDADRKWMVEQLEDTLENGFIVVRTEEGHDGTIAPRYIREIIQALKVKL